MYIHAGTQLIAQSDGTTTLYHLHDGLGSTRQLVDSTGAPVLSQTFDPYGNLYLSAGSGESSFGWAGEARDANGLTYLRARYYNPTHGRFLNTDPSRQEPNLFVYGRANPIMYLDPSGLCSIDEEKKETPAGQYYTPRYQECLRIVRQLESTYGIEVYWPKKPVDIALEELLDPEGCNPFPYGLPPQATQSEFKGWTLNQVKSVQGAFQLMDKIIGGAGISRSLLQGGAFFRRPSLFGIGADYYGVHCGPSSCLAVDQSRYLFQQTNYSIGFSDAWASFSWSNRSFSVLHEVGHRANDVITVNNWYQPQAPHSGATVDLEMYRLFGYEPPTEDAGADSREYFAETFAMFVWTSNGLPVPPHGTTIHHQSLGEIEAIDASGTLYEWTYLNVFKELYQGLK